MSFDALDERSRLLLSVVASLVFGAACGGSRAAQSSATDAGAVDDAAVPVDDVAVPHAGPANVVYVSFILNVHDWVFPDDSVATVGRVIDLHEKYKAPVDIYLTDPMLRIYLVKAPALVDRLRTSRYVTISQHVRPPAPYYPDYDWAGLSSLGDDALAATLLAYEEHAIDLSTGQPTMAAGGYELMKATFGYAPYVVGLGAGDNRIYKALAKVYSSKGARFTLVHNDTGTEWGATSNGLLLRPETVEVKVYEKRTEIDFESTLLASAMAKVGTKRPAFINLKWHEDNFHTSGTPWQSVYYDSNGAMKRPPWDTSSYAVTLKTADEMAIQWRRYEAALVAVLAHPETYTIAGARDFARMAGFQ